MLFFKPLLVEFGLFKDYIKYIDLITFIILLFIQLLQILFSDDLIFSGPKSSPVHLLQNPFQFHSPSDQQMKIIEISLGSETGPRQLPMFI